MSVNVITKCKRKKNAAQIRYFIKKLKYCIYFTFKYINLYTNTASSLAFFLIVPSPKAVD